MKKTGLTIVLLSGVIALPLAVSAHAITVENFNLSGTAVVSLPGTVSQGGVSFETRLAVNSLDFSPGEVTVPAASGGTDTIELHGTESTFSSLDYAGSILIPAQAGPAQVSVLGTGSANNPRLPFKGEWFSVGNLRVNTVSLGKGFSAGYFDVGASSSLIATARNIGSGQACAAQQFLPMDRQNIKTSVEEVGASATLNVVSVDAANGLVDFSGLGQISKRDVSIHSVSGPGRFPVGTDAGLILVLFGAGGAVALRALELRQGARAPVAGIGLIPR